MPNAPITLRDGSQTLDPRLDRLVQFDERSKDFPITAVVPAQITRGRTWSVDERLDQGREGACVGFGISHELAAYPAAVENITNDFALEKIYRPAQRIDEWPGENYSGTSVLAGTKIAQSLGYFDEYRWCFSVEEIMLALAHEGPVVVGTEWREPMYSPDRYGVVRPGAGEVVGGHCFLIRGFALKPTTLGGVREPVFRCRNSWGADWGREGDFFITVADYEKYLMPNSDAVVYVGRHKRPKAPVAQERPASGPLAQFNDPFRFWR